MGTERETWGRNFEFLLACIGFSVGLGNVWRFPYLCYKNGGGAFLIPYLISVVIGGIPLFFLEVAIGQFMGIGGVKAWNICPIFRGIGLSTLSIVFFVNCYYNVILAWSFRYLFASFTSTLPWSTCGEWSSKHCREFIGGEPDGIKCIYQLDDESEIEGVYFDGKCQTKEYAEQRNIPVDNVTRLEYYLDPVTDYWENNVLALSNGIDEMGPAKWDLVLCLLLAWIVVYLCICKGIRSSGKVMYVTATAPYIFMLILLIRNSMLEGAKEGVMYYLKPDFNKMKEMQVWIDAGTQIFFSYSISIGALTALGSYNDFHHNSYRDCIIFAFANSGTSLFAGFIIFTILGHMAHVQNVDISDVAEKGPGLAFIAYPKALTLMPGAPFWSIMFFLMLILLGLDSQFGGVEAVVTALVDQWPDVIRKGRRKEVLIGIVCFVMFLIGLTMVCPMRQSASTSVNILCQHLVLMFKMVKLSDLDNMSLPEGFIIEGGMYVFQLFDYYSGSRIILFVAAFMCISVAWFYGVDRFYDNLEMMYGFPLNPYMKICWLVLSPIFCMVIFIMSTINYSELEYTRTSGTYIYPGWAIGVGWGMAGFAAMWIPLGWLFHGLKYGRDLETFKLCLRPLGLQSHQMRPDDNDEETLADLFVQRHPTYKRNTSVDGSIPSINNISRTVNENPAYQKDDSISVKTTRSNSSFVYESNV